MSALREVFALLVLCILHTSCGKFFKSKLLHDGLIKADSFPRYTWTGTNVRFPTDDIRHDYVDNKKFLMQNSIQTRFQVHPVSKMVLMTMPRYYDATPITLALVDFSAGPTAPSFFAYPNWEMQEVGNPNALQSALDLFIDLKKLLYVLDTGMVNTYTSPTRTSAPKVVIINTFKRAVIKTIDLSYLAGTDSHLDKMIVETHPLSKKTFIYLGDALNNRILVWDVLHHQGWSVQLPEHVKGDAEGCGYPQPFYLALGRTKFKGENHLYFTHFCSKKLYSVRTGALQRNGNISAEIVEVGDKPEGLVILGSDKESMIYLRHGWKSAIYKWDPLTTLAEYNYEQVAPGDDYSISTAVAPGFMPGVMFGLESNFEDFLHNTTSCLGPTVSLFPLVKPGWKNKLCKFGKCV